MVAPGFTNHSSPGAAGEGAPHLLRHLGSIRSTFPGLRLEASDFSVHGSSVVAKIAPSGDLSGSFVGIPLDTDVRGDGYELLTIENDQVRERWGSRQLSSRYEPILQTESAPAAGSTPSARLERLRVDPDASIELTDPDGCILMMETGSLSAYAPSTENVRLLKPATDQAFIEEPVKPRDPFDLEPSDALQIPAGTRISLRNNGQQQATAIVAAVRHYSPSDYTGPAMAWSLPTPGVERELLAWSNQLRGVKEPIILSIGQATMAPGSTVPRHTVEQAELTFVTDGSVDLILHEGSAGWTRAEKGYRTVHDRQIVEAGQSAAVGQGSVVEYRNDDPNPATLLFVNVQPRQRPAT
jgi:SnoaL-like polyketide cyclase